MNSGRWTKTAFSRGSRTECGTLYP
jgi:hypothetical protein